MDVMDRVNILIITSLYIFSFLYTWILSSSESN